MITNDKELQVTLDRLEQFRQQVAALREKETNPENYRLAVSGFLSRDRPHEPRGPRVSVSPAGRARARFVAIADDDVITTSFSAVAQARARSALRFFGETGGRPV